MFCSFEARQLLDSRGKATVEAVVSGFSGIAPSGASTGKHELPEKRGKNGFLDAVKKINSLKPVDFSNLSKFDRWVAGLDLGSNASTALSFAAARAFAAEKKLPLWNYLSVFSHQTPNLPFLQLNLINGGKHAGLENDVQEHSFVSKEKTLGARVWAGASVYQELKVLLVKKFGPKAGLVGDEGGFVVGSSAEERLALLEKACDNAGVKPLFALDCAASEFYGGKNYKLGKKTFTKEKLVAYYEKLSQDFSLDSIEDGFAEDDWAGWILLNKALGKKLLVIGDDLLVTNAMRVSESVEKKACNSLLVKPNQVGSITAAVSACKAARKNGLKLVASHRSGETEDSFMAHFAAGLGCEYAKFGAPCRSERLAKYNELLRIEEAF